MKQILLLVTIFTINASLQAQKKAPKFTNTGKANDHFMIQLTADTWLGKPDSIKTKSIGRGANVYGMVNYPFKTNKHMSVAIGAGIGSSSVYFDKQKVAITGTVKTLAFTNVDTVNHYKKYKVTTAYLELPIELRFTQNTNNLKKSWKFAVGAKIGTLLNAYTKGKTLQDKNGNDINAVTEKLKSKKTYFSNSRIALTGRVGYGNLSLFAQYQVTNIFKDGVSAIINPLGIGIAISGL